MDELLKSLQGGLNSYTELGQPITEDDKNQEAQNNLRNYLINAVGGPESWKLTKAEEKEHFQNLPEMMGLGSMGTVSKIPKTTTAEAITKAVDTGFGKTVMANGLPTKIEYPKRFNKIKDIWGK